MSELRWNPLLGEWVVTATHRQDRTFLPPADFCPLCPTQPGAFATEIPVPDFQIAVFENKFPSFRTPASAPAVRGDALMPVAPSDGCCEVVVYSPCHDTTLADEPLERIENLVHVWQDRYRDLAARPKVRYILIFENKGKEIGVTLSHPHGQIYAFPYVPPIPQTELRNMRAHYRRHGSCLLCDVTRRERRARTRVVFENAGFIATIPFYARYPYEVHVVSRRHRGDILEFTPAESRDLAEAIQRVTRGYDRLFGFSFPYMMLLHQRPCDGRPYPEYHFHVEFLPPYRTAEKLKYLAGCESGAGTFINDTLAEDKAAELRAAIAASTRPAKAAR